MKAGGDENRFKRNGMDYSEWNHQIKNVELFCFIYGEFSILTGKYLKQGSVID